MEASRPVAKKWANIAAAASVLLNHAAWESRSTATVSRVIVTALPVTREIQVSHDVIVLVTPRLESIRSSRFSSRICC